MTVWLIGTLICWAILLSHVLYEGRVTILDLATILLAAAWPLCVAVAVVAGIIFMLDALETYGDYTVLEVRETHGTSTGKRKAKATSG